MDLTRQNRFQRTIITVYAFFIFFRCLCEMSQDPNITPRILVEWSNKLYTALNKRAPFFRWCQDLVDHARFYWLYCYLVEMNGILFALSKRKILVSLHKFSFCKKKKAKSETKKQTEVSCILRNNDWQVNKVTKVTTNKWKFSRHFFYHCW